VIPLDYATPQPPSRGRTIPPILRFGGGLAIGFSMAVILHYIFSAAGDDDPCCVLIGLLLTGFICCGLLRIGVWVRERASRSILLERNQWLSVFCGLAIVGILFGSVALFEHSFGEARDGWVVSLLLLGLPVASAWVVFRPEQIAP
jgi:hypothetical protein